jgi:hypothetical protein
MRSFNIGKRVAKNSHNNDSLRRNFRGNIEVPMKCGFLRCSGAVLLLCAYAHHIIWSGARIKSSTLMQRDSQREKKCVEGLGKLQ